MFDDEVNPREIDFLVAVNKYIGSNKAQLPSNQWLANELCITQQGVLYHRNNLREKGYLKTDSSRAALTPKAISFLNSINLITPTEIGIWGQVQAGEVQEDSLVKFINGEYIPADSEVPTITIPQVSEPSIIFALEVIGNSMIHENILDGDYVIVRRFSDVDGPKQGELIVTYYVPIKEEEYVDLEFMGTISTIPNDLIGGPTLKYYFQQPDFIRLSVRKNYESGFTILTRQIAPIGKVIGIYRKIE